MDELIDIYRNTIPAMVIVVALGFILYISLLSYKPFARYILSRHFFGAKRAIARRGIYLILVILVLMIMRSFVLPIMRGR
jgi:hypothetical protein